MERKYYLMASPDLLQMDYNLLADEDINTSRYSVDGQWTIVEYKDEPSNMPFPVWSNEEACNYLEANFNMWNEDSLAEP